MSGTVSNARQDAFWWQGSLMRIKARGEDTGGALGVVEGTFYEGFGPPLHVHSREDEAFYMLEGKIRFRQGDEEFVAGPGTWVGPPGCATRLQGGIPERACARLRHARRLRANVRGGRGAGH